MAVLVLLYGGTAMTNELTRKVVAYKLHKKAPRYFEEILEAAP